LAASTNNGQLDMFAVNPSYGSTALGSGYLLISYNGPGMEHGPKGTLHQTEPIRGPNGI